MQTAVHIRLASISDIPAISEMLEELVALNKRNLPSDAGFVHDQYLEHPDKIQCAVAVDENGAILGLQILKRASKDNPYNVAIGWGIIGTHVRQSAARRGVGKALFAFTRKAARSAGLQKIDASIGANNIEGLAYYEAIGFHTYETSQSKVRKVFEFKD